MQEIKDIQSLICWDFADCTAKLICLAALFMMETSVKSLNTIYQVEDK